MKKLGDVIKKGEKKYHVRPRYTVVLHDVRAKLDLSLSTYAVIDSINILSRTNPEHPYCTMSKEQLSAFLKISRATVFRAIQEGVKKGLLERTTAGHLRTTRKWVETVDVYKEK